MQLYLRGHLRSQVIKVETQNQINFVSLLISRMEWNEKEKPNLNCYNNLITRSISGCSGAVVCVTASFLSRWSLPSCHRVVETSSFHFSERPKDLVSTLVWKLTFKSSSIGLVTAVGQTVSWQLPKVLGKKNENLNICNSVMRQETPGRRPVDHGWHLFANCFFQGQEKSFSLLKAAPPTHTHTHANTFLKFLKIYKCNILSL